MNKKLDKQISDIKDEINDLIHGIEEEGRTGADICRELQYINELLDELLTENVENRESVEFVSYDGEYPNLCSGLLVIKVNGKLYELRHFLSSCGKCYFNDDGNEIVTKGDWEISEYKLETYYPELIPFKEEIEKVVNENVEKGCCGGCL